MGGNCGRRLWAAALGGQPTQEALATAARKTIVPALTPWGSSQAARASFKHMVALVDRLVTARAWDALDLERPTDWDDAKGSVAALLDAVSDLPADPVGGGAGGTLVGLAGGGGGADPAATAALDTLRPILERLGSGVRAMHKKDANEYVPLVANKEQLRTGSACAAAVLRPITTEAVIAREAALGSAALRGVSAKEEAVRLCSAPGQEGRAFSALLASCGTVTEKVGAIPSNMWDARLAAHALVGSEAKAAVAGPLARPDSFTEDKKEKVENFTLQFFEGRIDVRLLTELRGGVTPSLKRTIGGMSVPTAGDPNKIQDLRDAIDVLTTMALEWWRDVMIISAGPGKDFGIKSTLRENKGLNMGSMLLTLETGFKYTADAFRDFRLDTRASRPDVVKAWADAQAYDAEQLVAQQQIVAASKLGAKDEIAACKKEFSAEMAKLREENKALASKMTAFGARQKGAHEPVTPVPFPPLTGSPVKGSPSPSLAGSPAGPASGAPPSADAMADAIKGTAGQNGKRTVTSSSDLCKLCRSALMSLKLRGAWPCFPKLISADGKCPHGGAERDCKSCKTDDGRGDEAVRKVSLDLMKKILSDKNTECPEAATKASLYAAINRARL